MTINSQIGFLRKYINNKNVSIKDKKIYKGSPRIDYFKKVYLRHHYFSKQSSTFVFKGSTKIDFNNEKVMTCALDKRCDILSKVFLTLDFPKIVVDNEMNVRYINHLGLGIIKQLNLKINGNIISSLDGKKIYLINKLLEKNCDFKFVNKDTTISEQDMKYTTINTKRLYNKPIHTNKERLTIPIPFGFFKHTSLNLPLFLFNANDIEIELTLRPLKEIYTVDTFDKDYWYYAKDENHYALDDSPTSLSNLRKYALKNTDMSDTSITPSNLKFSFGEQTKAKSSL